MTPTSDVIFTYLQQTREPESPRKMALLAQNITKCAKKNNIDCSVLDEGRIFLLKKNGMIKHVYGYSLPINLASCASTCRDRAAASDIWKKYKIPQIRHRLFINPSLSNRTPLGGTWPEIKRYAKKHHFNVVCKLKETGSGKEIYHTTNPQELEQAATRLFRLERDVVISPFKPVKQEYRVFVYDNSVQAIIRKNRPIVSGDGKRTTGQLIRAYLSRIDADSKQRLTRAIDPELLCSQEIPEVGQEIALNWKHSMGEATVLFRKGKKSNFDKSLRKKLREIALRVMRAVGLHFASVSIVELKEDAKEKIFRVLEVSTCPALEEKCEKKITIKMYSKILNDLFLRKEEDELTLYESPASKTEKVNLADIVEQIAQANEWKYSAHSERWILHLSAAEKVRLVYGYIFPLNNDATSRICKNKAAASAVLAAAGIPQIRHVRIGFSDASVSAWSKARDFAQKHDFNVVCKPAEGTGGIGVEHIKSVTELDNAILKLAKNNQDITICSYKKILFEYRLIMIDGQSEVIFRKVPPFVVGDGKQPMRDLIPPFLEHMEAEKKSKLLKNIDPEKLISEYVPALGEKVFIHWKHNLGQGATCELIGGKSYLKITNQEAKQIPQLDKLVDIAKATTKALNARFVSVDIAEIEKKQGRDRALRVVEVNSGIMMENLITQFGQMGAQLATLVYTKALSIAFNEK